MYRISRHSDRSHHSTTPIYLHAHVELRLMYTFRYTRPTTELNYDTS